LVRLRTAARWWLSTASAAYKTDANADAETLDVLPAGSDAQANADAQTHADADAGAHTDAYRNADGLSEQRWNQAPAVAVLP
jgi:hypothetical protein